MVSLSIAFNFIPRPAWEWDSHNLVPRTLKRILKWHGSKEISGYSLASVYTYFNSSLRLRSSTDGCLQVDTPMFRPGDVVFVMEDCAEVCKLQKGHGDWIEEMTAVRTCRICSTKCYIVSMSSDTIPCVCASTAYYSDLVLQAELRTTARKVVSENGHCEISPCVLALLCLLGARVTDSHSSHGHIVSNIRYKLSALAFKLFSFCGRQKLVYSVCNASRH